MRRALQALGVLALVALVGGVVFAVRLFGELDRIPKDQAILEAYQTCLGAAITRLGHVPALLAEAGPCPEARKYGSLRDGADAAGRDLVYETRGEDWVLIAVGGDGRRDDRDVWKLFAAGKLNEMTGGGDDQIGSSRGLLRASMF